MELQIINVGQLTKWIEVLDMCYRYDFYHCPSYHQISVDKETYEANLYVFQEGNYTIAIPLIIRPINEIEGLRSYDHYDATSVYGYAGPVASHSTVPERIVKKYQVDLQEYLVDNKVVCAFSRLHPLIRQQSFLEGLGNIARIGQTISIDLRLSSDEQYSRYRKDHKAGIKKLRRLGAYCRHDQTVDFLEVFIDIYHENMKRVGAREEYFFDRAYFTKILGAKDFDMHLFACFIEDDMVCGGLFSLCNGIIQYHLSATREKYLKLAPMKLLIDEVRLWANAVGASIFHLGGGLGAEKDSLFNFKAGFSNTMHAFNVWQLVVMRNEYMELSSIKGLPNECERSNDMQNNFFPYYRRHTD